MGLTKMENDMGYSTVFTGTLKFTRQISVAEYVKIKDWLEDNNRDTPTGKSLSDRIGYARPEKFTDGYVDLKVNKDVSGIEWNGSEKTYGMVDTLNVLLWGLGTQFEPPIGLEGRLLADGESQGDVWAIDIVGPTAVRVELDKPPMTKCPHCEEWFETSKAESN